MVYISNIDENYRGRNYGQLLMNHVIHRAQLLGYQTIYLAAGKTDYYRRQGWYELEQYLHQKANKVYYKKYGELNSLEGKSNKTGIRFKDDMIIWNGLEIPVVIDYDNYYEYVVDKERKKKEKI